MERPSERGTKICSRHLSHMPKMAAMPIYGKNPSKIFFSGTGGRISTNSGIHVASGTPAHHSLFNDDPGVTLTYFTARLNLVP